LFFQGYLTNFGIINLKTMKRHLYLLTTAVVFIFASCSKEKQITKRLEGTWNIDKYEGSYTSGGQTFPDVATNAGTLTFNEGGTGNAKIKILGTTDDEFNFTWKVEDAKRLLLPQPEKILLPTKFKPTKRPNRSGTTPPPIPAGMLRP